MEAARLYESVFTDLTPHGPEGQFSRSTVDELVAVLTKCVVLRQRHNRGMLRSQGLGTVNSRLSSRP